MRAKKLTALFVAALFLGVFDARLVQAAPVIPIPNLLISEVQTGSAVSANQEFVEIYNVSGVWADLTGWYLEYKSATGTTWTTKATLSGGLEAHSYRLIATANYLDPGSILMTPGLAGTGGHLRLVTEVDNNHIVADMIGWGTADSAEGGSSAMVPLAGNSTQRCTTDAIMLDTGVNGQDFREASPTPGHELSCSLTSDEPVGSSSCEGIIITELVPNPSGPDTGNEYIELYNPTPAPITLGGCVLHVTTTNTFTLPQESLLPESYRVYTGAETGLTLPNTSGGTIYLLSAGNTELSSSTYPSNLADDVSWAWFDTSWELTYLPTPGAANNFQPIKPCPEGQERNEGTGRCRIVTTTEVTPPCPEGQVRNAETNRCRGTSTIQAATTACASGQEKNPATGRCRTITETASLTPCKPGQERNPATNRCRSVAAATTSNKPCPVGQERNQATNRCRKVATVAAQQTVGVHEVAAASPSTSMGWWAAGIIAAGAIGYAIFEWRQEIFRRFNKLKNRAQDPNPK